jgi:hypothetical protein
MTKPMITIHDVATGETLEREMNAAEFKQYEADQLAAQARAEAEATKAADKAALLAKLSITAEEAALLLS